MWETFNGEIASLRRQGNTLQAIGNTVGRTRERVRQILVEHYGRVEMELLPEGRAARIIGCGRWRLVKLRKSGVTHPVRLGIWFWLYDREEIEKAMLALQRTCPHCGNPLSLEKTRKYCPECSKESRRYNYPFMSEEAKREHIQACVRWQKEHPERTRELRRRAHKKYQMKKRRERLGEIEPVIQY